MSTERIAWRRASRGLYFLGFGVLLLLTTLDLLEWGFWLEALTFWPVLLVAMGVRLIFERSAAPWAVLLSPVIVFGTLAWVASTSHAHWPRGGWSPVVAEASDGSGRWTFEAQVAMADLDLESVALPPGRLVEGRVSPRNSGSLRVREWRSSTRVELSMFNRHRISLVVPDRSRRWELGLSRDLPMEMILQGAFTGGLVNLRAGRLDRLDLDGAFHNLTLRLPRPEKSTRITLDGAFNSIRLQVPAETPVSVITEGPVNLVDGRPNPPSTGTAGYRLRVEGFMNRVEIFSDPDDPSPRPEGAQAGDLEALGPPAASPPGGL